MEVNAEEVNAQIVDVVVLEDSYDERENEIIVNRPPPSPTITAPRGPLQSCLTSSQTLGFLIFVTFTSLECQISEKTLARKNRKKERKNRAKYGIATFLEIVYVSRIKILDCENTERKAICQEL